MRRVKGIVCIYKETCISMENEWLPQGSKGHPDQPRPLSPHPPFYSSHLTLNVPYSCRSTCLTSPLQLVRSPHDPGVGPLVALA